MIAEADALIAQNCHLAGLVPPFGILGSKGAEGTLWSPESDFDDFESISGPISGELFVNFVAHSLSFCYMHVSSFLFTTFWSESGRLKLGKQAFGARELANTFSHVAGFCRFHGPFLMCADKFA